MANKIMKTLTIGSNTYEIVDETARADIKTLKLATITPDITLSISGATADAKVTGDAIKATNNTIINLSSEVDNIASKVDNITLKNFGVTATATELNYVSGVNDNIQTQLDNKLPVSGTAVASTKLATSRIIQTNLGSESSDSFDGTEDVSIGVKGILGIEHGGTNADNKIDACKNIGAVNKNGDTITGTLTVTENIISNSYIDAEDNNNLSLRIGQTGTYGYVSYKDKNANTVKNGIQFYDDYTYLIKPLSLEAGGTGATDALTALVNLGIIYSETEPTGKTGMIWLKPI